ncbi:hypothetical protein AGMMS49965_19460 [Bacteroidia bacterium]|nr:hypothetical protein AGMMS49965_19460 [Bacteroidia bacterium]
MTNGGKGTTIKNDNHCKKTTFFCKKATFYKKKQKRLPIQKDVVPLWGETGSLMFIFRK